MVISPIGVKTERKYSHIRVPHIVKLNSDHERFVGEQRQDRFFGISMHNTELFLVETKFATRDLE